jgi:hypothetical protein
MGMPCELEDTILGVVRGLLAGTPDAIPLIEREIAFQKAADAYWEHLKDNRWNEDDAKELLGRLIDLDPRHPLLIRFDLERRRRAAMIARGQTP